MYLDLKARLDELTSKADVCSEEELNAVAKDALNLAKDALDELLLATETAPDSDFVGDEGIK